MLGDDSFLLLGFLDFIRGIFQPQILTWWSPLSLLGLGVLLGMGVLLVLWGAGYALSSIPTLGGLADNPSARRIALPAISAAAYLLLLLIAAVFFPASYGRDGFDFRSTALTALGFLPVAAAIGLIAIALVSRRTVREIPLALREGVLLHMSVLLLIVGLFGLLAPVLFEKPGELVTSLARWPFTGTYEYQLDLPKPATIGDPPPERTVEINAQGQELRLLRMESNEPLEVSTQPADGNLFPSTELPVVINVKAGEPRFWVRGAPTSAPMPKREISKLYVRNLGEQPAQLTLRVTTEPPIREVAAIPVTAFCVVLLYLTYLVQRSWMPRLSAVALATAKSEIAHPMFLILIAIGAFFLLLFLVLPFNTFGEDIKMLKTTGLQLVLVLCIIQAVWAAGTSVSEEIEGKTALTVLSKPINRIQFIVGKFLGISWTIALMFMILGAVFLFVVAYKPIYDGNEGGQQVLWQQCYEEVVRIVPGLALAFMETIVLAAISVAISTRLSMLANFSISFGIYVIGHLTPLIVQSSVADFEPVAFVGQLIATIFPVLDHFNVEAAVSGGADVPLEYLGWTMLYCLMYVTLAMLLALVLFEDRDLA